jgi:hypothetical protein
VIFTSALKERASKASARILLDFGSFDLRPEKLGPREMLDPAGYAKEDDMRKKGSTRRNRQYDRRNGLARHRLRSIEGGAGDRAGT